MSTNTKTHKTTIEAFTELNEACHSLFLEVCRVLRIRQLCDWLNAHL